MPTLNCTNYNTRSPSQFIPFKQKSQYFSKTFFPHTTKLYNSPEPQLRNNHDIVDFKLKLKEKYKGRKVKPISWGIQNYQIHCTLNFNLVVNFWLPMAIQ